MLQEKWCDTKHADKGYRLLMLAIYADLPPFAASLDAVTHVEDRRIKLDVGSGE